MKMLAIRLLVTLAVLIGVSGIFYPELQQSSQDLTEPIAQMLNDRRKFKSIGCDDLALKV